MPTLQWSTTGVDGNASGYTGTWRVELTNSIVDTMNPCSGITHETPPRDWAGADHYSYAMYPIEKISDAHFYDIGPAQTESYYEADTGQSSVFMLQTFTNGSGLGYTSWTGLTGGNQWRVILKLFSHLTNVRITDVEICRASIDLPLSVFGKLSSISVLGSLHGLNIQPDSQGIVDVSMDVVDQPVTNSTDVILIRVYGKSNDASTTSWRIITRTGYFDSYDYGGIPLHGCDIIATMDEFPPPGTGSIIEAAASLISSSSISATATTYKTHTAQCTLRSNAFMSALPEDTLPDLYTLQWQLESTDTSEAASVPISGVNQRITINPDINEDTRFRARFRIKNNTGSIISNFSPQMEVQLESGNWYHCQHPDRASIGLISRPYFGEYLTDLSPLSEQYDFPNPPTSNLTPFSFNVNTVTHGIKPNRKMHCVSSYPDNPLSTTAYDLIWRSVPPTMIQSFNGVGSAIGSGVQRVFMSSKVEYPFLNARHDDSVDVDIRQYENGVGWINATDTYGSSVDMLSEFQYLYSTENDTIYHLNEVGGVGLWNGTIWTNIRQLHPDNTGGNYGQPSINDELFILCAYSDIGTSNPSVDIFLITQTTLEVKRSFINYNIPIVYEHGNNLPYIEFKIHNISTGLDEYYSYDSNIDELVQFNDEPNTPVLSVIDLPNGGELFTENNSNYSEPYGSTYAQNEGLRAYKNCRYDDNRNNNIVQQGIKHAIWPIEGLLLDGVSGGDFNGQALGINVDSNNNVSTFLFWYTPTPLPINEKKWGIEEYTFPYKYLDRTATSQKMSSNPYAAVNNAFMSWGCSNDIIGNIGIGEEIEIVAEISLDKQNFDNGAPKGLFKLRITDFDNTILPSNIPVEILVTTREVHEGSAQLDSSSTMIANAIVGSPVFASGTLNVSCTLTGSIYSPVFPGEVNFNNTSTISASITLDLVGLSGFYSYSSLIGNVGNEHEGQADLNTSTSMTALGDINVVAGNAQFDILSGLSADATVFLGSFGTLHSNSSIQANGSIDYAVAATFNINSEINATAEKGLIASSVFNDNFSLLNFKANLNMVAQVEYSVSCNLSGNGQIEKYATSELNVSTSLIGTVVKGLTGVSNLSTSSNLNALAHLWKYGNSNLSTITNLVGNGILIKTGSAIMQSSTSMVSQADKTSLAAAELSITSNLLSSAGRVLLGQSVFECNAELIGNLTEFDSRDIISFDLYIIREVSISLDIN